MKIKRNTSGTYSAVLSNRSVNLHTKDAAEARHLAKAAGLEQIELAHRAHILSAHTFQRLTFGKTVTSERALSAYGDWISRSSAPLTAHRYEQTARAFLAGHLAKPVQIVTEKMVDAFVNPADKTALGTRKARHSALASFLGFCSDKGFVLGNPAGLVGVRTHDLSHEQMDPPKKVPIFAIEDVGELPIFFRMVALLGVTYGLRLSDVAGLEYASFAEAGKMVIFTDKTRVKMVFDLTDEVQHALADVPRLDPDLLFPSEWAISKSPTKRAMLSTQFRRLTGVNAHQLRHGFGTRLAREGESVADIQRRMGHASPKTTEGYIHEL